MPTCAPGGTWVCEDVDTQMAGGRQASAGPPALGRVPESSPEPLVAGARGALLSRKSLKGNAWGCALHCVPVGLPGMPSRTLCPEPAQCPLAVTDSRGTRPLPGMMKTNAVAQEGRSAFQTKELLFSKTWLEDLLPQTQGT